MPEAIRHPWSPISTSTRKSADAAAYTVDKVRINPGNFVDSARTFKQLSYTDEEYTAELQKLEERFIPFLNICKEQHTAIRLGVNHGSLSDRIMSRYGDTPEGMVESCMEFLRICRSENFDNVVISIKASNTVVMVRTVRLLIETMESEGMNYPLHLGVTEAGDGEDGRNKIVGRYRNTAGRRDRRYHKSVVKRGSRSRNPGSLQAGELYYGKNRPQTDNSPRRIAGTNGSPREREL